MENLDGGVCGVDALATGATGAADFDPDFVRADLEINFLGFGKDGDGGSRGMNAALGFGCGHALDAVDSTFVAEPPEAALARNAEGDLFEAAEIGGAAIEGFHLKAIGLGVAGIHACEVSGEESGFGAASAGADFHNGIAVIPGLRGEKGDLDLSVQVGKGWGEAVVFLAGERGELFVCCCNQFAAFLKLASGGFAGFPDGEDFFEPGVLAKDDAGAGGIGVEIASRGFGFQFFKALSAAGNQGREIHEEREWGAGDTKNQKTVTGPEPRSPFFRGGKYGLKFFAALGLDAAVTAGEFFNASGGINKFLFASEEGVAGRADADFDVFPGRAGAVGGTAGADDGGLDVFGMDVGFHGLDDGCLDRKKLLDTGDGLAQAALVAVGGIRVDNSAFGRTIHDGGQFDIGGFGFVFFTCGNSQTDFFLGGLDLGNNGNVAFVPLDTLTGALRDGFDIGHIFEKKTEN